MFRFFTKKIFSEQPGILIIATHGGVPKAKSLERVVTTVKNSALGSMVSIILHCQKKNHDVQDNDITYVESFYQENPIPEVIQSSALRDPELIYTLKSIKFNNVNVKLPEIQTFTLAELEIYINALKQEYEVDQNKTILLADANLGKPGGEYVTAYCSDLAHALGPAVFGSFTETPECTPDNVHYFQGHLDETILRLPELPATVRATAAAAGTIFVDCLRGLLVTLYPPGAPLRTMKTPVMPKKSWWSEFNILCCASDSVSESVSERDFIPPKPPMIFLPREYQALATGTCVPISEKPKSDESLPAVRRLSPTP